MRLLYRRTLHAIDNHGMGGLLLRLLDRVTARLTARVTARVRPDRGHGAPARVVPEVHPFDLRHGAETSGYVPGERLVSGGAGDLYNTAYYGISPSTLMQAIAGLPGRVEEFTFVDLGCGKGRALLIAAMKGFGGALGVEISPELAEVARRNAAGYAEIAIETADAAGFLYPKGGLVVFLYHPFLAPLLRRVLRNLVRQSGGREVYVLAANPTYPKVFAGFRALREVWTRDFTLSAEDAAADRHGIVFERYTLWRVE